MKMRYALYARKSSENEDRQIQSIGDQVAILQALARERHLAVVEEVTEARSAKAPDSRPQFARLLQAIEAGYLDALLCWNLNRLSRNPIDSGRLSWLLQNGVLKEIHTPERVYRPEDNVLLLAVEQGMANQFILDLKKAVERGMQSKIQKGGFPHMAPAGYLNDIATRTIRPDAERFALLERAWRLLLTGSHSIPDILSELTRWGYRTRPMRGRASAVLSKTSAYQIFTNPFYAGYCRHRGRLYRGSHPAMLSLEEFDRVQSFIEGGPKRRGRHRFAYTGLLTCARCGCQVTAEVQSGHLKRGRYVYYHCTNARGGCSKQGLREDRLDTQIDRLLSSVTLHPRLKEIALQRVQDWFGAEVADQEAIQTQQQQSLQAVEHQLNILLDMKLTQLISDAEYAVKKSELQAKTENLTRALARTRDQFQTLRQVVENAFDFAVKARENFLLGTPEKKREIARVLGIRYQLDRDRVSIELNPVLLPMQALQAVEPDLLGLESTKRDAFSASGLGGIELSTLDEPLRQILKTIREQGWVPRFEFL